MGSEDPARDYLTKTRPKNWSIRQYLTNNHSTLKAPNGFDSLCRLWTTALDSIADKSSDSSAAKRKVAKRLLESYVKKGDDWREARMVRAILETTPLVTAQPSIVVNNSGSDSFNNATLSVNIPSVSPDPDPDPPAPTDNKKGKRKRPANRRRISSCSSGTAPRFVKRFEEAFKIMADDKKWYLPSGVCVEDTLHACFKDVSEECAVHSWVINTRDDCVEACFTPDDWKVICDSIPLLPDPEEKLVRSMERFMELETAEELQDYLDQTPPFKPAELRDISSDERLGRRWVYSVIRCWSELLEDPRVFVRNHNENWYTCRYWATAFDKCISTIDGSNISRGETKSLCTSNRKNSRPPIAGKRRRVGHLYDGVVTINNFEVGVVEHGREFIGENSRKWCSDTLKVLKVLHDMLYQLQSEVDSPAALSQLQVMGIVTAEWRYQLLRMSYAKGYICILWADEPQGVPSNIAEFPTLLEQLVEFWKYRELLSDTFHAIINPSRKQLMKRLLKPSGPPAVKSPTIPRSVETDSDVDGDTDDEALG